MSMTLPLETIVSTAVEQISTGVQLKIAHMEEQKNREFLYQMKELEFYKSNYEKDLKDIFNYWFDLIRVLMIKDNKNLTQEQKNRYQKELAKQMNPDTISKYQMNTLKYGGKETARMLALAKSADKLKVENSLAPFFVWTGVLSVLKKEVLGQELDTLDILRVLLTDFDENEEKIVDAKKQCAKLYKERYGEDPYWK